MNPKFQQDPGRVYSCFGKILEKQHENEKPRYDQTLFQGQEDASRKFEDIEEASEFWKALWEGAGSGNARMEWIEDVREAMREVFPEMPTSELKLTGDKVGQTIGKKKNCSVPGPDVLANFWWKKVDVLHQDMARSFEGTAVCERDFPLWFSRGKTTLLPKPGEFTKDNQRPITCFRMEPTN